MASAFFFRRIPGFLFACALSFIFASPSFAFQSGKTGFENSTNKGSMLPQIRLVIGDEGTEGSEYKPSIAVVTPEVPRKGATEMPEAERCKLAEKSCKDYEENMFQRCKRLQSPEWTDQEDCGAIRPEHFEYCMSMSDCD